MQGLVEAFARAREFLADADANGKGEFARNVRSADIIAVTSAALTGAVGIGRQATTYSGDGSYNGPLDANGNMPSNAAGIIIGSAIVLPRRWVVAEEAGIEQSYQALAQDCSHVVTVGGTDIIAKHGVFSTQYASVGGTGIATGPLYGINDASAYHERQPEPLLWVGPGERVTQSLYVRRALALGANSITPELALLMVVADLGVDAA